MAELLSSPSISPVVKYLHSLTISFSYQGAEQSTLGKLLVLMRFASGKLYILERLYWFIVCNSWLHCGVSCSSLPMLASLVRQGGTHLITFYGV